jgi:hypothetical protein
MEYRSEDERPGIPGAQSLVTIFRDIEINARSSGRSELLLMLDRVPGLVIGHENSRDNAVVEAHMVDSLEILRSVRTAIADVGAHATSHHTE